MENKQAKEQEKSTLESRADSLEWLKRYVDYTLKNIDDFERRIRKERKANGQKSN